jgi:uncharacterized protein (DUF1501 family)
MDRRDFMKKAGLAIAAGACADVAWARPTGGRYDRLLVLIELKGGNDGLNTVIPYADSEYYVLRPRIALVREQVLALDERTGLHPSLEPLLPMWRDRELGIVQSVGYPSGNLSHFRSIEIWDTASRSDEYLTEGWLARTFTQRPTPPGFVCDGVVVGDSDMGPLAGSGTRAIALANTTQFLRQSRLAAPASASGSAALKHILRVEQDIVRAAAGLNGNHAFRTMFPKHAFGVAVQTACQVVASRAGVPVVRISLNGFDTHSNQPALHARLLRELAEGMVALRQGLTELGRWKSTLAMTYAEFGRRPRENQSNGTDHGTANVHFVAGGAVRGGLYGLPPALDRLDANGNPPFAVDFRELYATALEKWWGVDSAGPLAGRFRPVEFLRA